MMEDVTDVIATLEGDASADAAAQVIGLATRYFEATRRGEGPVSSGRSPNEIAARFDGPMPEQGTDLATIDAVHVNPGPPFTVGSSEVVATIPQLGEAWDVDRRSGRMVLTQAVGTAGARIIVLMNWLDEFRRTAAATR